MAPPGKAIWPSVRQSRNGRRTTLIPITFIATHKEATALSSVNSATRTTRPSGPSFDVWKCIISKAKRLVLIFVSRDRFVYGHVLKGEGYDSCSALHPITYRFGHLAVKRCAKETGLIGRRRARKDQHMLDVRLHAKLNPYLTCSTETRTPLSNRCLLENAGKRCVTVCLIVMRNDINGICKDCFI